MRNTFLEKSYAKRGEKASPNKNILRTKGAFNMKLKTFFIIFKGFLVVKN